MPLPIAAAAGLDVAPQGFDAIAGNAPAVAFLRATLTSGRIAHAYLFVGPAQVGKHTLSHIVAAALVCSAGAAPPQLGFLDALGAGQPPAAVDRPCGACRACRLLQKDAHPDVRTIAPESGKRGVTIEQVRQLEHAAGLRPFEGERKVFIVTCVDAMTDAAANALLKTLEEPPDDTILLLTAGDISQVLPTIVSRCRAVPLRAVPAEEIAAALVARGTGETEARLLARLAGGRPGWALSAAADPQRLETRTQQVATLETLVAQPRIVRLQAAGSFGDAASTKDLLDVWLGWWRDALLTQQGCEDLVANVDRLEQLRHLGAPHDAATLWRAIARVQEARQQIDANVNVRLAVEALLLDLPETSAA